MTLGLDVNWCLLLTRDLPVNLGLESKFNNKKKKKKHFTPFSFTVLFNHPSLVSVSIQYIFLAQAANTGILREKINQAVLIALLD